MNKVEDIKSEIKDQYDSFLGVLLAFKKSYMTNTPWKIRLLDSFIVYNFFLLIIQIIYMLGVGNFPKNSFLSGVICCIGSIALTSSFRISLMKDNANNKKYFLEYLFAGLVFYMTIVNFMG